MRRYEVTVKFWGTTTVEVDVPNGEDPEEYAIDIADPMAVDEWEMEATDVSETDPDE